MSTTIEGFFGLAPDDLTNGPSFISTLYKNGMIPSNMVGLGMKAGTKDASGVAPVSSITLGGYTVEDLVNKDGKFVVLNVEPNNFLM